MCGIVSYTGHSQARPSFWMVYRNWNTAAMTQPVLPFVTVRTKQKS